MLDRALEFGSPYDSVVSMECHRRVYPALAEDLAKAKLGLKLFCQTVRLALVR